MKRCVIIGGADIHSYERIKKELSENDFYIFCDSGLKHMAPLGIVPHLIVGDFDSHEKPDLSVETMILPREKDDSDTVFAAKEGLKRGFDDFLLLGAAGRRLDHTLCNVSILLMLEEKGKKARLLDDFSVMEIVSREPKFVSAEYPYFSLMNITGDADGITVENAKFPLENGRIPCEYQFGLSNEPLAGKEAKITLREGRLLLVKVENP
ncbi:MAG: thiamine diphosphokinase [Clostridia bacterium]|nr:thiamine diphosphokinase [Clostridia bacterium]